MRYAIEHGRCHFGIAKYARPIGDLANSNDETRSLASSKDAQELDLADRTCHPKAQTEPPSLPRYGSVETRLLARLSDPAGVMITELCDETGCHAHSVRTVMSRLRSKGTIIDRSIVDDRGTVYRRIDDRIDVTVSNAINVVGA